MMYRRRSAILSVRSLAHRGRRLRACGQVHRPCTKTFSCKFSTAVSEILHVLMKIVEILCPTDMASEALDKVATVHHVHYLFRGSGTLARAEAAVLHDTNGWGCPQKLSEEMSVAVLRLSLAPRDRAEGRAWLSLLEVCMTAKHSRWNEGPLLLGHAVYFSKTYLRFDAKNEL